MRNFSWMNRSATAVGALLVANVLSTGAAGAQAVDPRWQPWLGCWMATDARALGGNSGTVCLVPAQVGTGVEVAVVAEGKLVHSEEINSTGQRQPKTVESCPGWESGTWSTDGRRLMLRSEYTCGQTMARGSSVFAMSSEGEWIEVRGTLVGASSTVRVVRYTSTGRALERRASGAGTDSMPFAMIAERGFAARYARLAAGERVSTDAVLDVVRHVDTPVAEAWLNENRQGFSLDGTELVRLADAGMPSRVIDLMVALSYPQRFAVRRSEPTPGIGSAGASAYGAGVGYYPALRYGDAWNCGYGYVPSTSAFFGDDCYRGYYGYGGYGYGSYGYGNGYYGPYGGYYWGARPLIIVPSNTDATTGQRGQAVKGQGYTRRSDGATSTQARPGAATSSSSGGSSTSGGASSSSGASSSGGDGGRTAKPRVPPL